MYIHSMQQVRAPHSLAHTFALGRERERERVVIATRYRSVGQAGRECCSSVLFDIEGKESEKMTR